MSEETLSKLYLELANVVPAGCVSSREIALLQLLKDAYALCDNGDFKNGCTSPAGADEGEYRAGQMLERIRAALGGTRGAVIEIKASAIGYRSMNDSPCHLGASEAESWASGWNAAVEAMQEAESKS